MNMKKWLLLSLIAGVVPLTMQAQDDDMYFVAKKKKSSVETVRPTSTYSAVRDTYYSGSNRDVDEYNRRGGSYYETLPGDSTNDVIYFSPEAGVYPDSTQTEDYQLTKKMSRWEGYEPTEAYLAGYTAGRRDSWGWHSPWYYATYYPWYDSWYYTPWYDPWYYGYSGWYAGWHYSWYDPWYDPWYYGYSWYYPRYHYYGGGHRYYGGSYLYSGTTGTQRHGRINYNGPRGIARGNSTAHSAGTFGGARSGSFGNRNTSTAASRNRTRTTATATNNRTYQTNQYGNFGGNRSTATTTTTRSTTSSSSSSGSFGGSRSSGGGGSFGGSRSSGGGGGSFGGSGGGRSGGGSFGGRR